MTAISRRRSFSSLVAVLAGLAAFGTACEGVAAAAAAAAVPAQSATSSIAGGGGDAPAASPGGEADKPRAVVEFEADERLGRYLLKVPGDLQAQTLHLFELVTNEAEPDVELKKAAMRRLQETDPRIITAVVTSHLADSAPAVQIAMLDMTRQVYQKIGGLDATLDDVLVQRIRDSRPEVARKAIDVTSQLGIQAAYLPLREIASTPEAPLRSEAITAMGRLRDPRAVIYFKKLLESDGAPKEDIYHGLAAIGRPAALLLKEKMNGPHAVDRDLACDALVTMADGNDLSALYSYIQKYPPQGERKQRIYDAIATLEARGQERPSGE